MHSLRSFLKKILFKSMDQVHIYIMRLVCFDVILILYFWETFNLDEGERMPPCTAAIPVINQHAARLFARASPRWNKPKGGLRGCLIRIRINEVGKKDTTPDRKKVVVVSVLFVESLRRIRLFPISQTQKRYIKHENTFSLDRRPLTKFMALLTKKREREGGNANRGRKGQTIVVGN